MSEYHATVYCFDIFYVFLTYNKTLIQLGKKPCLSKFMNVIGEAVRFTS